MVVTYQNSVAGNGNEEVDLLLVLHISEIPHDLISKTDWIFVNVALVVDHDRPYIQIIQYIYQWRCNDR